MSHSVATDCVDAKSAMTMPIRSTTEGASRGEAMVERIGVFKQLLAPRVRLPERPTLRDSPVARRLWRN